MTLKYFNVKNGLVTGNITLDASNGNVTASSFLGNINVTSNANLGTVDNIKISGGSYGYVLQTDGTGNLSWTAQTGGNEQVALPDVTVDSFTGDGSLNSFSLTKIPTNKNYTFVNVDGVFQFRDSYTITGDTLVFGSTPLQDSVIEVSTMIPGAVTGGGSSGAYTWNVANANATMATFNGYFADTSVSALTLTLPATATLGDSIKINDLAGTFATRNLTISRNGANIEGVADNLVVDYNQATLELVFSNSTYGWKVIGL